MATNAQTALTNRQYYAIHGDFGPPPKWFEDTPPDGKPDLPTTINGLNPQEQAALRRLIDAHENEKPIITSGLPNPDRGDVANVNELQSDLAKRAYAEILDYHNRPAVKQWMTKKRVQRIAQWKLFNADVHDEAEQATIVPVSGAASGTGENSTGAGTPVAD